LKTGAAQRIPFCFCDSLLAILLSRLFYFALSFLNFSFNLLSGEMFNTMRAVAVLAAVTTVQAFFPATPQTSARDGVVMMGARKATPLGRTTTTAGKEVRIIL
jgi:hypothetical protein